jgi:hypothetical protein
LTQVPHYRARELGVQPLKVCTREMSSLRHTAAPGKEPRVFNWHGSSRGVLRAKNFWELAPWGRIFGFVLATLLVVGASAPAADLAGRVTSGTTRKPAVGDDVLLIPTSGGSGKESVRVKTDGAGRFRLSVADTRGSYLVRVVHQGVAYDKIAQPNANFVAVQVYDVADKLDGVTAIMDVQRFEATGDRLEVKQLITMRNTSVPPRTLVNDRPFEIRLPPEAQVLSGLVQVGESEPLKSKPVPGEHKDEYYFRFPLRPGDTRFAIVYRLAYNGKAMVEPRIRNAQERFVVMLPKSMTFEPQARGIFQPMLEVSPDNVQGTGPVTLGQTLAFRISGTGTLTELQGRRPPGRNGQRQAQNPGSTHARSGPENLVRPFPAFQDRDSFILIGLTLALIASTLWLYLKRRSAIARAKMGTPVYYYQWQPRRARRRASVKFGRTL